MRLKSVRFGAALVAGALVVAACGSSAKTATTATTSPGTTAAGATSSTSATSISPSTTAPSGGAAGGAQPGITAATVTVASVAIISGPVPGLFQGAPYGAAAYFAYINSLGGVNGRQIKLDSLDDAFSCQTNTSDYANNVNKVFAFVGSMSLFDNCGSKVLAANPSVSSIAFTLSPEAKALPNQFDPETQPTGYRLGSFKYYKQTYPNNLKVGGIYGTSTGAEISWNAQIAAMKTLGYQIAYARGYSPTETSFTSDIIRMKNAGVNFLWVTDDDIGTIARLVNEANQQNWHPLIVSGNTSYDANLPKLLSGDAGNGMLTDQLWSMFQGEDRTTVPAVSTYLTWLSKTHPGFQPDLYSVSSWSGAELFVQALKAAGPNPTRAGVQAALKNIHSFDADGLIATNDPGGHQPSTCYLVIKYQDKKWQRVTPATGFQCQPGGYYYYKPS